MDSYKSFNSLLEDTIKKNWDNDALTDYKGATLQYHDVARKIEKLHILFEHSGIKKGDKICQGIILPFGTFRDEMEPTDERTGGLGSTGR